MFTLQIKTDLSALPSVIETNIAEREAQIRKTCEEATALVVNPDDLEAVKNAEKKATELNGSAKRLADFRIAVTKQWSAPLDKFVTTCKSFEKMLKEASATLKGKADEGREKARDIRKQYVWSLWMNAWSDNTAVLSSQYMRTKFDEMCDSSRTGNWLLRSKKDDEIIAELGEERNRFEAAVDSYADATNSYDEVAIATGETELYTTGNLDAALAKARTANDIAVKAKASVPVPVPVQTPAKPSPAPVKNDKTMTFNLAVTGTKSALKAMREYGESLGITFKKI